MACQGKTTISGASMIVLFLIHVFRQVRKKMALRSAETA
jgi:hypothetical protein